MILIYSLYVFLGAIGLAVLTRDFSSLVRLIAFVLFLVMCFMTAIALANRQNAYEAIHAPRLVPVPDAESHRQSGRAN